VNVILQALAHVVPVRDFFLQPHKYEEKVERTAQGPLVLRFGEVVRRLWSKDNFKSTVSPHDFLQEAASASKKHFRIGKQGDSIEFLSWLLNLVHLVRTSLFPMGGIHPSARHRLPPLSPIHHLSVSHPDGDQGLTGGKRAKASVLLESFQGEIKVQTQTKKKRSLLARRGGEEGEEDDGTGRVLSGKDEDGDGDGEEKEVWTEETVKAPFLFLTVDIPQTPLFKDSQGGIIIPQVPLYTVLEKFGGQKLVDVIKGGVHQRKRYWITRLPRYLILSLGRFTRNHYFVEKNPTIVNFPVKNLELKDCACVRACVRACLLRGLCPASDLSV